MAWSYIDGAANIGNPVTTLSATVPSAINAGDLIVAHIISSGGGTITVSDNNNAGNYAASWAHAVEGAYFLANSVAIAANGLTVTLTSTASSLKGLLVDVFRGAATSNVLVTDTGGPQDVALALNTCSGFTDTSASQSAGNLVVAGAGTGAGNFTVTACTDGNGTQMTLGASIQNSALGAMFSEWCVSLAGTEAPQIEATNYASSCNGGVSVFAPAPPFSPNVDWDTGALHRWW